MERTEKVVVVKRALPLGMTLFFIFLVLKLTGNIDWSWWWVAAPLWIPTAFVLGVAILVFVGLLILNGGGKVIQFGKAKRY